MNIIFGTKEAEKLQEKYIVLELDTVTIGGSTPIVAYCIIENMLLDEMPKVDIFRKLHNDLMQNYRNRNWDFCIQALDKLIGFWNSQVDSFYEVLKTRILNYKVNDPDDNWNGIIPKK
jgi:hypothetical protein